MMHNLIPYILYLHGDDILLYFTDKAKEDVKEDGWDEVNKRVVYYIDQFIEEEVEDKIELEGV